MTQRELNRAVAAATGEPTSLIRQRGFSLADPLYIVLDPESCDGEDSLIDWDALDAERWIALAEPTRLQPA